MLLAVVACGPVADGTAATAASQIKTGMDSLVVKPDQIQTLVAQTIASQLSVAKEQIQIEKVEAVQWSDSSLGCAQAGQMYAQVITPGFRVSARVQGQVKNVHTDQAGRAIVCDKPTQ